MSNFAVSFLFIQRNKKIRRVYVCNIRTQFILTSNHPYYASFLRVQPTAIPQKLSIVPDAVAEN
jgi:hypothetical protein